MILGRRRKNGPNLWQPHRWYAWRPVHLQDGRWAWLEAVYRRQVTTWDSFMFIYEVPQVTE